MNYQEFVSRNIGFFTIEAQERISKCPIAILGCGMGSVIGELLVRTGFQNIIVADGDKVELSNLNRQAYSMSDLGTKKVKALEKKLRGINSDLKLKVYDEFLGEKEIKEITKEAEIIVDAIGIDALPVVIKVHQIAREQGKVVVDPINLGFGGCVIVFTLHSKTFEEMIGIEDIDFESIKKPEQMLPYWVRLCEGFLPEYLKIPVKNFLEGVKERGWCNIPQIGIGVYITAALTVTLIVRILEGKAVPYFTYLDPIIAIEEEVKQGGNNC